MKKAFTSYFSVVLFFTISLFFRIGRFLAHSFQDKFTVGWRVGIFDSQVENYLVLPFYVFLIGYAILNILKIKTSYSYTKMHYFLIALCSVVFFFDHLPILIIKMLTIISILIFIFNVTVSI